MATQDRDRRRRPHWEIERQTEDGVVTPLTRDSNTSSEIRTAALRVQDALDKENYGALRATLVALKRKVFDRPTIVTAIDTSLAMVAGTYIEPKAPRPRRPNTDSFQATAAA